MKDLTRRQGEILGFIADYSDRNGFPPSVRDIGQRFGLNPATVHDHLRALERKGALRRTPHQSRAMALAKPGGRRETGPSGTDASVEVPVLGRIAAGRPALAEQNVEDSFSLPQRWVPAGAFLLRVSGDSMRDAHILDGDYVLVRPQPDASNGEIVAALIEDEATVKRFYRTRQGIELRPENPDFEPLRLTERDPETVSILGRVVGVFRI